MRSIRHLALAAALAGASFAATAADTAGRGITGPELADILQKDGYRAQLGTADDGEPMVETRMSGINVTVHFYDCKSARCGSLQFVTALDLENGVDPAVVEKFNSDFRYARMSRDDENDPVLRYDFEVLHAMHAPHVTSQIDIWENLLGEFVEMTGFND